MKSLLDIGLTEPSGNSSIAHLQQCSHEFQTGIDPRRLTHACKVNAFDIHLSIWVVPAVARASIQPSGLPLWAWLVIGIVAGVISALLVTRFVCKIVVRKVLEAVWQG